MFTLLIAFGVIVGILLLAVIVHILFIVDRPIKRKWRRPTGLDDILFGS